MVTIEKSVSEQSRINDIYEKIVQAANGLRFGSIEIVVHNGKVVQIERKEKLRFDKRPILARDN